MYFDEIDIGKRTIDANFCGLRTAELFIKRIVQTVSMEKGALVYNMLQKSSNFGAD